MEERAYPVLHLYVQRVRRESIVYKVPLRRNARKNGQNDAGNIMVSLRLDARERAYSISGVSSKVQGEEGARYPLIQSKSKNQRSRDHGGTEKHRA